MRPVEPLRRSTVVICAVLLAALSYVLVRQYYGVLPRLSWIPSITTFVVAALEGVAARATRARIARKPGTVPIEPLAAVRLVALARASALVATLLLGVWGGMFAYAVSARGELGAAAHDTYPAGAATLASLLLLLAALWLETSCRAPDPPEDDPSRYDRSRNDRSGTA